VTETQLIRNAVRMMTVLLALLVPASVQAAPYLVFDAASGEVVAEEDAFHPWYPASLTKLMTAYVTFEAIARGEVTADSPVVMTPHAAKEPPSKMGFKPGTAVTVDTALKILIVKSANDVAVALAEAVGGSETRFVARMNQTAARLGMTGTRFTNPNGLPDPSQWTTARDYALLARAIIRDYPEYRDLFRITALQLGGKVIRTHNHLLERFPGTDGMKTGFICSSGFNVVASTTRNGRRLVAVVMGQPTATVRAEVTAALLETAFASRKGLFSRRPTLENLRPAARPPSVPTDLREEVCGRNRQRGEDANAEISASAADAAAPRSYLVPRFQLMSPVQIAIGVPGGVAAETVLSNSPLPRPNPNRARGTMEASGGAPAGEGVEALGLKGPDS
jgi:D-alanyl-D-alanine carboxypeptidase